MIQESNSKFNRNQPRLRVLFLGNSYNSLSVACLLALLRTGHTIFVGVYDPTNSGFIKIIKKGISTYGISFVASKAMQFVKHQTAFALYRLGFRTNGFGSLPLLILAHKLTALTVRDPNSRDFVQQVKTLQPDLIVVAAFSRILKAQLIATPRLGCVNVHPSLLPSYRGPDPYFWVLRNKEKKSGVTVHYIDEGIDSGNIIVQREVQVDASETESTLENKCNVLAATALEEAISLIALGEFVSIPQSSDATYYSFRNKGAKTPLAPTPP